MRILGKSVVSTVAVLTGVAIGSTVHASPAQDACETNTISDGETGVVGNPVGTCGAEQIFTSPDGNYGSTGCTNAWIVEVDDSSGNPAQWSAGPASSVFPSDQATCQATQIWLATFDGNGDGALHNSTLKTCEWVSNPPFAPACDCSVPFIAGSGSYDVAAAAHARGVVQVRQNGSFVPATVFVVANPC